jgi:hypothetical protein
MTASATSSGLPTSLQESFEPVYSKFYEGNAPSWAMSPSQLAAQKAQSLKGVTSNQQQQLSLGTGKQVSKTKQYPVALVATKEGASDFSQALQALGAQAGQQMSPYTNLGAQAAAQWGRLLGLTPQEQQVSQQRDFASTLNTVQQSLGQLGETTDPTQRAELMSQINNNLSQFQQQASGDSNMSGIANQIGGIQNTMNQDIGPSTIQKALEATPGYKFRYEQGMKAVEQSLAGRGLRKSGQALKELTDYGQGMASQEYGNLLDRYAQAAGFGSQLQAGVQQLQTGLGTRGAEAQLTAGQEFRRGPASMHSVSKGTKMNIGGGSSKGGGVTFK